MGSRRTISVAVSYILLIAVAVVTDAILVSIYIGFISMYTGWVPRIVHEISQGLVYGMYMMSPCTVEMRETLSGKTVTYTVVVPCLYISLVNPNPVPVEVILLGHIPSSLVSGYKVLDLLALFGIYWDTDDGNPPPGVSVVGSPTWLVEPVGSLGTSTYRALRMSPGVSAVFRVPLIYGGTPSEVLACTKVGCTKLYSVGSQTLIQRPSASWILIPGERQVQSPQGSQHFSLTQTWMWRAYTLGGRRINCIPDWIYYMNPVVFLIIHSITAQCCGNTCPPGTKASLSREPDRGMCPVGDASGYIVSPSSLLGYPPRVLVGYFTTDQDFDFRVPSTLVTINGRNYNLYGFDSKNYNLIPSQYTIAVGEWALYDHKECNRRIVTLTASIFVDPDKTVPLSTIYPRSRKLYIYGVTRGYIEQVSMIFNRYDNVHITAIGRYTGGKIQKVTVVVANGTSDNVSGYVELDMDGLVELIINVEYVMIGEEPFYCHLYYLFGTYCGSNYDRHVRLAFYVELIPEEILS